MSRAETLLINQLLDKVKQQEIRIGILSQLLDAERLASCPCGLRQKGVKGEEVEPIVPMDMQTK